MRFFAFFLALLPATVLPAAAQESAQEVMDRAVSDFSQARIDESVRGFDRVARSISRARVRHSSRRDSFLTALIKAATLAFRGLVFGSATRHIPNEVSENPPHLRVRQGDGQDTGQSSR